MKKKKKKRWGDPENVRAAEEFDRRWDKGRELTDAERKQMQEEYLALLDKRLGKTESDYDAMPRDPDDDTRLI